MRQVQVNKTQSNGSQEACFISTRWLSKFNTFAEPGPIDNYDFMCHHNRVKPTHEPQINHFATMVSGQIWDYLHSKLVKQLMKNFPSAIFYFLWSRTVSGN